MRWIENERERERERGELWRIQDLLSFVAI